MAKFKLKTVPNITAYYWDGSAISYDTIPANVRIWCHLVGVSLIACQVVSSEIITTKASLPIFVRYPGADFGCDFITAAQMALLYTEVI